MERFHAIEIYDDRPVDSGEILRIKLLFEVTELLSYQMSFATDVQLEIMPRRLDPVYLLCQDQNGAARGFYWYTP